MIIKGSGVVLVGQTTDEDGNFKRATALTDDTVENADMHVSMEKAFKQHVFRPTPLTIVV